jgi:hypothetical protein
LDGDEVSGSRAVCMACFRFLVMVSVSWAMMGECGCRGQTFNFLRGT